MIEETYFDNTIRRLEFLFRFSGINIRSKPLNSRGVLKTRLVFIFEIIWLNTDLSGGIYWFIDGLNKGKDFLSLTYIAPCIAITTLSSLKAILMLKKEKETHQLMDKFRDLERKDKARKGSPVKTKILDEERFFLHSSVKLIIILLSASILFFTLSPMILMWLNYKKTNEVELILPFLILYPFDPFNINVYPFVYMHQFWSELLVLFNTLSADGFFFACCTYMRIQFKYLQHHIEELFASSVPENVIDTKKYYKEAMKDLVMWHQELLECAVVVENTYTYSILFNFISSCFCICLTGFNVTKVPDLTIVFNFFFLLAFGLAQAFLLCFFADLLRKSSEEVGEAVYRCNWIDTDTSTAKSLLIMKIRAQKPCTVTAAGFADVTLNSFMKILSTSWSYFALLQTLYKN